MIISRVIKNSPVNLNKIKQHLRVVSDDDNEYIEDLAIYAISYIESRITYNINEYTTTITGEIKANDIILLDKFKSLTSVKNNNVNFTNYSIIERGFNTYILFNEDAESIEIKYEESTIQKPMIQHAINLLVADYYENREAANATNKTLNALDRILILLSNPLK